MSSPFLPYVPTYLLLSLRHYCPPSQFCYFSSCSLSEVFSLKGTLSKQDVTICWQKLGEIFEITIWITMMLKCVRFSYLEYNSYYLGNHLLWYMRVLMSIQMTIDKSSLINGGFFLLNSDIPLFSVYSNFHILNPGDCNAKVKNGKSIWSQSIFYSCVNLLLKVFQFLLRLNLQRWDSN